MQYPIINIVIIINQQEEGQTITFFSNNTEESGRSMVEMLGVLAIVGVLSVGGIAGFSKAMAKYKLDKTLNQISMILTNVHTTFGDQYSYAGLTTARAIIYNIVGEDLSHGNSSTLINAYNGNVTVNAITTSDGTTDCNVTNEDAINTTYCPYFKLAYTGLPQQACIGIATSDWGRAANSNLISIKINDTLFTWGGENKIPVTFSAANTACNKTNDTNTLTWIYE